VAVKCAGLRFNCPQCKTHFKRADRVESCPGCGTDLHCGKWAVPGYQYCEDHGGPAPSRNFYGKGRGIVTGDNSQFALTRLASKYVEMTTNGQILSNRAAIEIVRKRVQELLERVGNNQFPDQLITLQELWQDYNRESDSLGKAKIKYKLDAAFEAIYHDYAAWNQIFTALDLDSKMVEKEAKIAKDLHAILSAEDAYKLVAKVQAAIISSISQEPDIPDRIKAHFLKRIEYEFTRIVGEGTGEEFGGSSGEIIDA